MTDEPLNVARMAALKAAFTESDLPFRVDIVDWARTSESFWEVIEKDHVVLTDGGCRQFEARSSSESDEWRESTLGGVLLFSNGKTSPERSESFPHPVYGSNGIIGFSDETNASANTTIIGRVGSYCGSLHYSDKICWVTDNAIRANAANENDAKFLFYLLQTLRLNDRRAGSGQPLLNQTILSSIPVVVPHPLEQRTIAHVLGALDDKIELNRRMNETLEAMARALFKSWFVDFGPTNAKIEGHSPYLDSETWALFPNRLDKSGTPEGWEASTIGQEVDVVGGSTRAQSARITGVATSAGRLRRTYRSCEHPSCSEPSDGSPRLVSPKSLLACFHQVPSCSRPAPLSATWRFLKCPPL